MKKRFFTPLKRLCALILVLAMTMVLLSGCGGQTDNGSSSSTSSGVDTTSAEFAPDFKLWDENGETIRINRTSSGDNGVVTSARVEASRAGLEIIELGGNAVDAAIAVSFALNVVEPAASGIGGGALMMIHTADGENIFLDGREFAPMAADPDLWPVDDEGKVIDKVKTESGKAVCVPTNVATLLYALENYGSGNVTREQVIAPAIRLATEGYEVSINNRNDTEASLEKLAKYNGGEGSRIYTDNGLPYEAGTILTNPDLANTLQIISDKGLEGFYEGEIAEKIVAAVQESGGVMTLDDLLMAENCQPIVREPVIGTYRDYTIIAPSLVSSGGTHIIEMLNILENFDLSNYAQNSAEYMSLLSEVLYMAFADRAAYMGDPAFQEGGVPIAGLTSKEYAADRAAEITVGVPDTYSAGDPFSYNSTAYTEGSMTWGDIVTGTNANSAGGSVIDSNTADTYESHETTHYSVADKDGNMVSCTQTINGYFGSGVVGTGLGFPLNNQCSDFGIGWGLPNSVEGGKKPLSSMSPSMVLDPDGNPFLVLGSPGGTHIFPTVLQCIIGAIDYGLDVSEMVNAPRIWYSNAGKLTYETRIAQNEIDQLTEWGYVCEPLTDWSRTQGTVNAIMYGNDGKLYGTADSRKDGKALGY
jgi:gamma-glutamyltranspeptidase / glutathione hydrolase